MDKATKQALRTCAQICWTKRAELRLTDHQVDQVLHGWLEVGTQSEAEAAQTALHARRKSREAQSHFDNLLGEYGANGGNVS